MLAGSMRVGRIVGRCARKAGWVLALACAPLGFSATAHAAGSVYVTAPYSNGATPFGIAQFGIGSGGQLSALTPQLVQTTYQSFSIAATPDGRHVYAPQPNAILQYNVDPATGRLSPMTPASVAADGTGALTVSPDGRSLYASGNHAIAQFSIDPTTGALSAKSPATIATPVSPDAFAIAPNGKSLYASLPNNNGYDSEITSTGDDPSGDFYALNDTSGPTAKDSSICGSPDIGYSDCADGTYHGGVTHGTPGAPDQDTGVTLDGTSGYVNAPGVILPADVFTISAWIKPAQLGRAEGIAQRGSQVQFLLDASNHLELRQPNVTTIATSKAAITDTTRFHQVVVTKAGGSVHLYIDGTDVTGTVHNRTLPASNAALTLGYAGAYLKGGLADVGVIRTALTPAQVAEQYASASNASSVAQYAISPSTGALSPASSATVLSPNVPIGVAVTPDGRSAYVLTGGRIVMYNVNASTGALTPKTPATLRLTSDFAGTFALSPDGHSLYENDGLDISQYTVDPSSGQLTPKSPATVAGPQGQIAAAPDGTSLYAPDEYANPLTVHQYDISQSTGALSAKSPASAQAQDANAGYALVIIERAATTALTCSPNTIHAGTPITCTATVTDVGHLTTPTGSVAFTASGAGSFSDGGSCTLASTKTGAADCHVIYTPTTTAARVITGAYGGDGIHATSRGSTTVP